MDSDTKVAKHDSEHLSQILCQSHNPVCGLFYRKAQHKNLMFQMLVRALSLT